MSGFKVTIERTDAGYQATDGNRFDIDESGSHVGYGIGDTPASACQDLLDRNPVIGARDYIDDLAKGFPIDDQIRLWRHAMFICDIYAGHELQRGFMLASTIAYADQLEAMNKAIEGLS